MSAYYNEFDPFAAEWLRELIKDGLIADGVVDERSIVDVEPKDLREFTQCHFFAGIGGWSYAARLAGWSDDRPMWTGSPPCQPFSTAGNRKGKDDLRHLWPVFFNLIRECQPSVVFGEQVASAIRMGWFDDLQADLEAENYASGMVVLPAASVGAPHKRDRLFYAAERVGNTKHDGQHGIEIGRSSFEAGNNNEEGSIISGESKGAGRSEITGDLCDKANTASRMANTTSDGRETRTSSWRSGCERGSSEQGRGKVWENASDCSGSSAGMGDTKRKGLEGHTWPDNGQGGWSQEIRSSTETGFWDDYGLAYCRDGKYRQIPTEPSLFPLANGLPNRVGILRGAGNAIVPQVGAEVIKAYMND